MNNTQPEALRLAELLTADEWPGNMTLVSYARECVAELRRQHARIAELEAQLSAIGAGGVSGPLIGQPQAPLGGRWYMVNRDGMATLCTDRADAEKEAEDAQSVWPHMGPHRAVQLVEVGASARGLIDAAQAVVDRWDTPLWKDVEHTAVFINRLRAALTAAAGVVKESLTAAHEQPTGIARDDTVHGEMYYTAEQVRAMLAQAEHSYTEPSPMAKVAAALRQKAEQEDAAYQARRSDQGLMESEWGPMEDAPPHEDPPMHVAVVEGDDTVRTLRWNRDVAAFAYPAGTLLYAARPRSERRKDFS